MSNTITRLREGIYVTGHYGGSGGSGGSGVQDVIINGSSILSGHTAYIPTAAYNTLGVTRIATATDSSANWPCAENVNNKVFAISSASTDNEYPSAKCVYALQTEINNLKNIGRFLAIWNSATGLPLTNPTTLPYTYKTGDYYRVGTIGSSTNYKPDGSTYTGTASTVVETESVEIGWVYYYDGTNWMAQSAGGGGTVQDVQINGTSIIDSGSGVANIPNSSSTVSGVMTSAQYTKLDGVSAGAQVNVLEGVQINGTDLTISSKKVNIPNSSSTVSGVMTSAQYTKLDGIEAGADITDATNVSAAGAVMYTAQSKTDAEKAQARTNIGAVAMQEYNASASSYEENILYYVVD